MAKTFNLTAQINLQGPTNIKPVVAQIKRELGAINTDVTVKFDPKAAKGVDALSQRVQNLNRILIETNKNSQILSSSLNNLGTSIKGLGTISKINTSVSKTSNTINATAKATKAASSEMVEFGKQSALAIRRFAAFSVVGTGVVSLVNSLRVGTKAFIEFDKQLIRLQQVTGSGNIGIKALKDQIIELATTLGVSSESLTEVAVTLAQAGFSARETQQALTALAKTELAPSFDNITDTTEGAIAAIRQFGIETKDLEKVLGSINAVAAAFAVESSDIITAIQRAGGAFAASSKGVSQGADALNEFIAIFTSVRATTRESAETIATGLRTIFTRIQRGSTIDFLREFGVELTDVEGKFVGPYEAIKRLSSVLNTLDPRDLRFSQIVEELGGFRQISKVIPLIQQFSEAQKALGVAQRGQGSLSEAQIKAQQSLANQIARVREEFLALSYAIGDSATFRGLFKLVLGLTSGLIKLANVFKPLLPLIATLGVIQGGKALTKFGSGFLSGIKKGGGAGNVGTNIGESLSGASSEKTAIAAEKTASALTDNTKSLTTLTAAVESLTQTINSRSSGTTLNGGGKVLAFARGGTVPGTGNRDTVPAMLQPGEFVLRKKAVETIGSNNLHKINKYAKGGIVETSSFPIDELLRVSGSKSLAQAISNSNIEAGPNGDTAKIKINSRNIELTEKDFENIWSKANTAAGSSKSAMFKSYAGVNVGSKNRDLLRKLNEKQLSYKDLPEEEQNSLAMFRSAEGRWGKAYEEVLAEKLEGNWTSASNQSGYPIDIVRKAKNDSIKSIGEAKFRTKPTDPIDLVSKLLRYRIDRNSTNRYFKENDPSNRDLDVLLGKLDYFWAGDQKLDFYNWIQKQQDLKKENFNSGGLVQKFLRGGTVEETAGLENMTVQESVISWLKELGGIQGVKSISGVPGNDRTLDSALRLNNIKSGDSSKLQVAIQAVNKALGNKTARKAREAESINKAMKLAIVGLEPLGLSEDRVFDTGFGKAALLLRALPNDPMYASLIGKTREGVGQLSTNLATGLQSANAFGGDQPIALDFDETLVKGADIFGADGRPDIPAYDDLARVKEALKNGQPTELAEKLKSILGFDPSFIDKIRVLTARPQESAGLLAEKLNSIGLPIPASKIQGTRGGGSTKASKLGITEKLIDDNYDNIMAAISQGKTAKQYAELREIEEAEQRAGGIANAEGAILQLALSKLGAQGGTIKEAAIDFEKGLGLQASQVFGLPPDIPTEVKRTLSSAAIGRAEDEFTRYFGEKYGPFSKGSDVYGINKTTGLPVSRFNRGGKASRRFTFSKEPIGPSPFETPKAKIDYYSLEKDSGFKSGEFDMMVQYAKTNAFNLDEFKDYLNLRASRKAALSGVKTDFSSLLTPETLPEPTAKQQMLAEMLKGEPDPGYRPMRRYAEGGEVYDEKQLVALAKYRAGTYGTAKTDSEFINRYLENNKSFKTWLDSFHANPTEAYKSTAKTAKDLLTMFESKESLTGSKRSGKLYSGLSGGKLKTVLSQIGTPLNSNKDIPDAINKTFNLGGSLLSASESVDTATQFLDSKGSTAFMSILRDRKSPSIDVDKTIFDIASEDDVIERLSKFYDKTTGKLGADITHDAAKRIRMEQEFILPPSSKFRIDDIDSIRVKDQEDKFLGGDIRHIQGMRVQQFAKGGSAQDTVPALLTPGEFVINKKAAQKIGYGKLHKMNKADKLQGYNKGGIVDGIQRFADGGDVTGSQEWADITRQMSVAAGATTNLADFLQELENIESNLKAAGKIDLAQQVKKVAASAAARNSDSLINNLTSSSSGRANLRESQASGLTAEDSLNRLADALDRNVKVAELFAASAEQAGISVKEFQNNIKNQILEKSLSGEAGRKSNRLDLRKEFTKTRLKFSPDDVKNLDNQDQIRESLQQSLSGLLDPSELNDAIDEIIYGLGTGARSLEEIAGVSPEVAKALDSARDRAEAMANAHRDLEEELGGLTDAVKVTREELDAFEYKKSGKAQQDFGLLGNMNPGGALAFKNSKSGSRLFSAAQSFQETGGLGRLPIIGKSIGSLGKSLGNLPGPIGSAIKAVGGLPGAFAALSSIIGSEFIPMLLKATGAADSEIGAGVGGALARGGSLAASMGALGNQIAGPIGAMVGTIGGAVAGAIKGFSDGIRTKALENALKGLTSQIETVDKAFEYLAKNDNTENVVKAQKETVALQDSINKLETGINPSIGQRAADAGYYGTLATAGTFIAGLGLVIGGTALGATGVVGTAATAGAAAPLGAAGVTAGGYMVTAGGAMMMGAPAVGAAVGGGAAALGIRDDINDESLQGHLKAITSYVEGISKLAERDIKLKNLEQLEEIVSTINGINKDLETGKISPQEADSLKEQEYMRLGQKSSAIEQAQRGALMRETNMFIDPNKDVNEQIGQDQNLRSIAEAAADTTAYNLALEELGRKYDATSESGKQQILKEKKNKDKLIDRGYVLAGMQEYQAAAAQRLALISKEVAIQTENLVEAYNKALAGIGRFKNELENTVMKIEENASMLTGEGGMGRSDRTQEQMLRNMSAYTAQELAPVLDTVQAMAGGGEQGQKLTDSIRASKVMQDILPGILRTAGARDVNEVTKELSAQLANAGIGEEVRNALVKEVEQYLDKETSNRSGDSFEEVLANFPALADAINTTKKAQEVGVAILEAQNDALDAVNQQLDQYNKYLRQSLQWNIKADQIRLQGAIALDRALGRDVSLERLNAPFETEIKALTQEIMGGVGTTDPVAIAEQIRANQERDQELRGRPGERGLIAQSMDAGPAGAEATKKLIEEQARLARSSQDAYDALEKLATNGDIAANILGKIEDERQQGKNVIDFVRKVSTQSAEDAVRMQRSFKAFDLTLKGGLNLGNRENRQLAYEGMDSLLPLLKGSETGNKIIGKFTKQMLVGQGVDINKPNAFGSGKTLSELIDAGTTGIDPGTQKLIELYNKSIGIQQQAATELARLNGARAQQHLAGTETILNNLYNNLPMIIATALANPQAAANGEVAAPALVPNTGLPAIPVVVQNAQADTVGIANGGVNSATTVDQNNTGPVVGQNLAGPANTQTFNVLATAVPKLDLTMLNTIRSIDTLNIGIVNLNTTVKNLADKLSDSSDMATAMTTFDKSTIFFGSKVDIFDKATLSFGSYVDKLSTAAGLLSDAKITMGGSYTVDVRVSGAAAFQAIEEGTQKLIDKEIGLAMGELVNKLKKVTGMDLDLDRR